MNLVFINGKHFSFTPGQTVLSLLNDTGHRVPSLCHDERLPPSSVCRLCLVKIKGLGKLMPACSTFLADGMEIETHSDEIESYRKETLRNMAGNYPQVEITNYPRKEFHKWLRHYEINPSDGTCTSPVDDSHPYLRLDMSRCINCFRCVNICNNLQGQLVWHILNRGNGVRVVSDSKSLFINSSCVSCGGCADTCPTGAIEDKQVIKYGEWAERIRSVCAYCGVGCEIGVGIRDGKVVGINPVKSAPVNKGHLCVKGRYSWEYLYSEDRVTKPMIRRQGKWETVTWEEAIEYCSGKFAALVKEQGSDCIGVIGSARATNEDNYLLQKFARAVIGTNNVDNCARVCHQPTAKAMSMALGTGASTNSYDDIEIARTILIAGANPTGSHPVIGARIRQAVKKGASLIVIDPRRTELAALAACYLPLKPGTDIPLFNAMAYVMVTEDLCNLSFVKHRVEGWELWSDFIREWTPERAAEICGIRPSLIYKAARLFANGTPAISFHGLGLTEHTQGTENVLALVNLALITGNIGKPGSGINPLRGQNNVQGAAAMGCDPSVYTGMASVRENRQRFESLWGISLPAEKGMNLPEMLDAAAMGKLKAMWITGYDVFFTMPYSGRVAKAFDSLDFVIVQDMYLNETAQHFADVFLPCASSYEREGTFMNAERRIQKIRAAIPAPLDVKADWEIVCRMAECMGKKKLFSFSKAEDIWNEIRNVWNAVNGITWERLDRGGIQWPCPDVTHPGTRLLHANAFPTRNGKAKLFVTGFSPTPEQTTPEYPFILITGRELYHFNAGTMTYRTANKNIISADLLHMCPDDSLETGIRDNDWVKVISRYGETRLKAIVDHAMKKGELFCTFNDTLVFINKVTSAFRDKYVLTPEYKVTAVRIEKEK